PPYKAGCDRFRALLETQIDAGAFKTLVIGGEWTAYDTNPAFRPALEATIRRIAATGTRVVLLGQVPLFPGYDRACLARAARVRLGDCEADARRPDDGELAVNGFVRSLAESIPGVSYRSVRDLLCDGATCSP